MVLRVSRIVAVSRSDGANKGGYGDMQIESLFRVGCIFTVGCSQKDLELRDIVVYIMSLPAVAQTSVGLCLWAQGMNGPIAVA